MNDRGYVALYLSELSKIIDKLNDADKAAILNALADLLEFGKCYPTLSPVGELLWEYIYQRIVDNWQHYDEVCNKHKECGRLGGRPKKQKVIEENQKNQKVLEETNNNQENLSIKNKEESIKDKEEIINNKEYSFKENIKRKSKQEREDEFRNKVADIANGQYQQDMIDRFCDYWTESNEGENCKLKFEMQKTFDIARRLVTWNKNNFNNGNFRNTTEQKSEEQRRAETEAIVNIVFDNF